MPVWDTFSKRQARIAKAGLPDVYQFDDLPDNFRMQVAHIWSTALGVYYRPDMFGSRAAPPSNGAWQFIHDTLARELGVGVLAGSEGDSPKNRCLKFLTTAKTHEALDIIELSFMTIDRVIRKWTPFENDAAGITQDADDAIEELNHRFEENCIGYRYVDGDIVRVDSQFIHAEAVKPALSLLSEKGFEGPAEEFRSAFAHYTQKRYKEAIAEASKSFESTIKVICAKRGWKHPANATAIPLIGIILKNGLIPSEMESHFAGLRSAMESGLPTLANTTSRHGQGATTKSIPAHFASYALHLTASNIVFLVEADKNLK